MQYTIFDFDGVLGDSLQASVAVHMRLHSVPAENYQESLQAVKAYLKEPKHARNRVLTSAEKADLLDHYRQWGAFLLEEGFDLFGDVMRELEAIKKQFPHNKMAVVTSGSEQYVLPALQLHSHLFDQVLAIEDSLSKEDKVEQICKEWGVLPSQVVYVTDTTGDFLELRTTIPEENIFAVTWGWHSYQDLAEVIPPSNILTNAKLLKFASLNKKVITIGGGETFANHVHYLEGLKNSQPAIQTTENVQKWRDWLRVRLNSLQKCTAMHLTMPCSDNAQFEEWKIEFEKISPFLGKNDTIIGHSLGGIFLLNYLSQNPIKLAQIHLIGTPFKDSHSFNFDEKALPNILQTQANIHFHHSQDDFVVPFEDFNKFKQLFATMETADKHVHFHEYTNRNHFLVEEFPELLDAVEK